MANDLTNVIPKILEMGRAVLRENAVMPYRVNRDYDTAAAKKGAVINIPKGNDFAVIDVAPGANGTAANNDIVPTNVPVTLDTWIESGFSMSDKEMKEVQEGVVPMSVESAVASICNRVDADLLGLYKTVGNSVGTAGTDPFATIADATAARKFLVDGKMPMDGNVSMVLDAAAEAKALQLAAFHETDKRGDASGLGEGYIGRKFGMDWMVDQNVGTHTAGTITDDPTVTGAEAIGSTSVNITCDAGDEVALLEGDLVTFGGSRTYTVTADVSIANSATGDIAIYPALEVALAGTEALAVTASSTSNLCFHRNAFVLASRPLSDIQVPGSIIQSITDDVTGLTLRLEVSRQNKQTKFSFDVLYGYSELYPELAARVLG